MIHTLLTKKLTKTARHYKDIPSHPCWSLWPDMTNGGKKCRKSETHLQLGGPLRANVHPDAWLQRCCERAAVESSRWKDMSRRRCEEAKRPQGWGKKKPKQAKPKHGKHTVIWPPAAKYTCSVLMWPRLQKKQNPNPTKKPYKTRQITRQPVGLHTSKPPSFHHHLQVFLSNVSSAFQFPLLSAPSRSPFHQRLLISKERLLRRY